MKISGPGRFLVLAAWVAVSGCDALYDRVGGNFRGEPADMMDALSPDAKALIEQALAGLDRDRIVDYHTHIVGLGMAQGLGALCEDGTVDESGLYINPMRFTWRHPVWKVKTSVLMSAARIEDLGEANAQYARRLLDLVRHFPGKGTFHLLAMDAYYEEDGTPNWEKTDIHVPNRYVVDLAACLNSRLGSARFVPVISVHPYRRDAVDALRRFAGRGVRFVKWLPNIMNIDPANMAKNGKFYEEMVRLDMVLITHTGKESALRAFDENQKYGNPLLYRPALDLGLTLIMAHSGRDGENPDENGAERSNFALFLQMMAAPQYNGCLFGDVSGMTIRDARSLGYFADIIADPELNGRMVNGSDYPLPAAYFLNPTSELVRKNMLTAAEQEALDAIYGYNPLLFDFVVKRTLRHPKTGRRLPASMFLSIDANRKRTKCRARSER